MGQVLVGGCPILGISRFVLRVVLGNYLKLQVSAVVPANLVKN